MTTLYYIHDPMCSWCYGFARTWHRLQEDISADINIVRVLGGLAPDTDDPMPKAMQQQIANGWHRIEQHIPWVKFNFAFWEQTIPRRSTYPACRAVIAARQQGEQYDQLMTEAIQDAYYQQARNPSDESTLVELADGLGLDKINFKQALHDPNTQDELLDEIKQARIMHVDSFPSLVLEQKGGFWPIAIDYTRHEPMLELVETIQASESSSG